MTINREPLPSFLAEPSKLGSEISLTGKWMPSRGSSGSGALASEWAGALEAARSNEGVLAMEVDPTVVGGGVVVHQVFRDADALVGHLSGDAKDRLDRIRGIAQPDLHLVRGISIPAPVKDALAASGIGAVSGDYRYGFVRNDHREPHPSTAINVTAKWTCKPGQSDCLEELKYWWQRVGTDAFSIEEGLVRFEAYEVPGEDALIIHETFEDTKVLKFHLTKGTAKMYKKDLDRIADAERYVFRGPVSWLIRTYSKFLRLPATYSKAGARHAVGGDNMSDGLTG